jgi:hypothetical protein
LNEKNDNDLSSPSIQKQPSILRSVAPKNLFIPWGGLAGITLFVISNTEVHKELVSYQQKYSHQVYLPAYQHYTTVCSYCPFP